MKKQASLGVTLIEILLVVGVFSVLTGIVTFGLTTLRQRARDAQRRVDLHIMKAALAEYYADLGFYPMTDDPAIGGFNHKTTLTSSTGNPNPPATVRVYLQTVPKDPLEINNPARQYCYQAWASIADSSLGSPHMFDCDNTTISCQYFTLHAVLEDTSLPFGNDCEHISGIHGSNYIVDPF